MIDYLGVVDNDHFHAVVRTALRAHGFCVSTTVMEQLATEHIELGRHFVEDYLPRCAPAFADTGLFARLQSVDRDLWQRIPLAAALGWRQTRVLQPFGGPRAGAHAGDILALGASFNAIISIFDYLADEHTNGIRFFHVLEPKLVAAVFDFSCDIQDRLESAFHQLDDPYGQVLLAFVCMFATEGRRLCLEIGNHDSWKALGALVLQLLYAESCSAMMMYDSAGANSLEVSHLMEQKSVLPSVAMLHIAQLGADGLPSEVAIRAASALGRVFWRVDDMVDLLVDCRRGVQSTLVARLSELVASQGRGVASEADLYDIVDQAAHETVCLLDPGAFADASPAAGVEDVRVSLAEFARSYVGAWVNWRNDSPQPARCGHLRVDVRQAVGAALEALLAEQREGFSQAIHNLHLPRINRQQEVQPALLFFRAVALDAMLDARDAGFGVPETTISCEALKVLQSKHRLLRGGWSYIPGAPELPPDADDNGQVVQVLLRIGGRALAAACEESIRMSLDAMDPDGGVTTWTVDPRGDTQADEAARAYLSIMGGWGVHPEVVANFAYGVSLYDLVRFAAPLQDIASYLEKAQNDDGSWTSKWYDGPFYGTFRAAAVLGRVRPASLSVERARTFMLTQQQHDGSWGEPLNSPLSTAFALLALKELGLAREPGYEHGVEHLKTKQSRSGHWPACLWIRFPSLDGEIAYGSETITTAFCLKALAAVHELR